MSDYSYTKTPVLDHGYVMLRDKMGSDNGVADAARVSYDKQAENYTQAKNEGLVRFLAREGHTSPFRHQMLKFEIYAPLMVARQWWKYVVGSDHIMDAWNESSRRYVTEEPVFYIPLESSWREKPQNSKQGSGKFIPFAQGMELTDRLARFLEEGEQLYRKALEDGVATEQARLFLPAYGMYVRWKWTTSLQGVAHFINQRDEEHAQWEIQQYAKVVKGIASKFFPVSIKALTEGSD